MTNQPSLHLHGRHHRRGGGGKENQGENRGPSSVAVVGVGVGVGVAAPPPPPPPPPPGPPAKEPRRRGLVRDGLGSGGGIGRGGGGRGGGGGGGGGAAPTRPRRPRPREDARDPPPPLEGVRLRYFDEDNALDGAAADAKCRPRGEDDDDGDFPSSRDDNPYCRDGNDSCDDEEEDMDDDCSEASGGTVVHDDRPPPPAHATREERNRYYWEWCYGPVADVGAGAVVPGGPAGRAGASARRSAPAKSCLSTNKKQGKVSSASMTPRRILHHSPENGNVNMDVEDSHHGLSTPTEESEDTTPKNGITRLNNPKTRAKSQSAVKFGTNSAAEFDFLQPIIEMTPIPTSVVQEIFPSEVKETEKDIEEQGVSRETARNVTTLAEWDDDFDDIINEEDDEADPGAKRPSSSRGRKRTPYKSGRRSRSRGASRPRKSRRESSIFSRERKSLVDPDDGMDVEEDAGGDRELLPLAVTIDPEEYTSPSSNSASDSFSTLATPGAANEALGQPNNVRDEMCPTGDARDSLDSTASACISPSSLRPEPGTAANGNMGRDAGRRRTGGNGGGDRTAGRETPNSARTSSSTILRAVHTSGALLPGGASPNHLPPLVVGGHPSSSGGGGGNGELRPNQLKYSPSSSSSGGSSSSTVRMDLSPSGSELSSSSIVSLLNNQSLDDSADHNLCKRLSILSAHPKQHFFTTIEELVRWISTKSRGSTPMNEYLAAFLVERVCKGYSTQTFLALFEDESNESIFRGNSEWIQAALFHEKRDGKSIHTQTCLESIVASAMNEIMTCPPLRQKIEHTFMANAETETLSYCIYQFRNIALSGWLKMELDTVSRCLSQLPEMEGSEETENIAETMDSVMAKEHNTQHDTPNPDNVVKPKLKMRRRRSMSLIEREEAKIACLENQLAVEMKRLDQAKRAKLLCDAHLEVERASTLEVSEDIRQIIVPGPSQWSNGDLNFPFFFGPVEIAMKLGVDHEGEKVMSNLGCFFNDSPLPVPAEEGRCTNSNSTIVKLLQAILLGNIMSKIDRNTPLPLRKSLAAVIQGARGEELIESVQHLTHIFSRVDALAQSVRDIETIGLCEVSSSINGDVTLVVSMHHEGKVVQIAFPFNNILREDWHFTTIPDETASVSIVSSGECKSLLGSELQERVRSSLTEASSTDPNLLPRICDEIMAILSSEAS